MHGRAKHSTNPPTPDSRTPRRAAPAPASSPVRPLPEPSGPTDERFVYHLTPEAERVLAEAQAATRRRRRRRPRPRAAPPPGGPPLRDRRSGGR